MSAPVNGHGAVDLGAMPSEEQRQQLATQLLIRAGLMCPCGERVRGEAVMYHWLVEEMIPTDAGTVPGIKLKEAAACSPTCEWAQALEQTALARREVGSGHVTWLDEPSEDLDECAGTDAAG